MGKALKNKNRKLREEWRKSELMDWAQDAADDAKEFLSTASPLEISRTLAEIGVSTSHRAGVEEILNRVVSELTQAAASPDEMVREFFTRIVELWKSELQIKGKPLEIEDLVFLFQTAQYFTLNWVKVRLRADVDAMPMTPGLLNPALHDLFPFKKLSAS
jgi:hypothetical protein